MLVSFYNLVSDSSTSSLEDNKIKNEVNSIRNLISSTNYKTKFVIVLVADGVINNAEIEERLVNIRRGTNFDSKSLYYLPNASSTSEINDFAKVLFSTLHPPAIEYYRDLSKHARRKRNRNTVPAPTIPPIQSTASVLPLQGWNIRYEFKLGIFAETRQELEAASRNYEQAYEGLFHPDLFDAIPAWSSRFNEARMLADVLAFRLMRCALWSSQTAYAVRWWSKHKDRMHDLLKRRGKGVENYSWEAWQSIWSQVMVDLIQRSEVFSAAQSQLPVGFGPPVQILPEKNIAGLERQHPWETLHHEGYWLNTVRKHIDARRKYTEQLPTDAKSPTVESQHKQSQLYDTYLTPEPSVEYRMLGRDGENYGKRIVATLVAAVELFRSRDQARMVEMLKYKAAIEAFEAESWSEVVSTLRPLWSQSSWRQQGWWTLLTQVGELLLYTAAHLGDHELCLLLLWELEPFSTSRETLPKPMESASFSTAMDLTNSLPRIMSTVAFATEAAHVGEPLAMQISLNCALEGLTQDFAVVEIKIVFDGGLSPVLLKSSTSDELTTTEDRGQIDRVDLSEVSAEMAKESKRLSLSGGLFWSGRADLTTRPGQIKCFNLELVPREAGPVSVASTTFVLVRDSQQLTLSDTDLSDGDGIWWEIRDGRAVSRSFGMHRDVKTVTILPKPPKADIKLPNLATAYHTNEKIALQIEVSNEEEEKIDVQLAARLISPTETAAQLEWQHLQDSLPAADVENMGSAPAPLSIPEIAPHASTSHILLISELSESADHELELTISYTLKSDPANTLTKQMTADLPITRPFEASVSFQPRIHTEPWPDFFSASDTLTSDQPHGLKQKYLVLADVGCFAHQQLVIKSMELKASRAVGGAMCSLAIGRPKNPDNDSVGTKQMLPDSTDQFVFDLEAQKIVLGERSTVAIDFVIDVQWSRVGSEEVNTSMLTLPRFLAPMSEPRVLLQVTRLEGHTGMHRLVYTIENPSMHFLTFNISMEIREAFAFSGPKTKSVSLVPISRYDIEYRIYMQMNEEWLPINLTVLDAFFGQTLKVLPASGRVRLDKQGNIQIWSGD